MFTTRSFHRLAGAALAATTLMLALPASAQTSTVDLFYSVPRMGISLDYFAMGYSDGDGNFVNLTGNQIVSASVVLDFTPDPGVDITGLHMTMAVPVTGSVSEFFEVGYDDLVEIEPGHYRADFDSSDFNGTIRSGRFSIESYALDGDGNPISVEGLVGADTGFYFTVQTAVPEPASALMLLAGLALAPVLARRRAA